MRGLFTNLRLRWRALWKRRQLESDLEDELAFHLVMREQKNQEAGVEESARRSFGNAELVKEDLRDQWTFRAAENFWRDLRRRGCCCGVRDSHWWRFCRWRLGLGATQRSSAQWMRFY